MMTELEKALFEGEVHGIIAVFHENERPLRGLAGNLDWHFHGLLSRFIVTGAISGKKGECAYLPITRNDATFHIFLAGAGPTNTPGLRTLLPSETTELLQRNLAMLGNMRVGVSRADLGDPNEDFISKHFKGVSLWIGN